MRIARCRLAKSLMIWTSSSQYEFFIKITEPSPGSFQIAAVTKLSTVIQNQQLLINVIPFWQS